MGETKRESATRTRELLVEAAIEEFSRSGFTEANINRISIRAGFGKGTVYNYFSDKRSLLLETLETIAREHVAYIVERVTGVEAAETRLTRFFAAGFAYIGERPTRARLVLASLFGFDQSIRERLGELYAPLFESLARDVVARGMAAGRFGNVDPSRAALSLMTLYLGTAAGFDETGRSATDPAVFSDFALKALATEAGV